MKETAEEKAAQEKLDAAVRTFLSEMAEAGNPMIGPGAVLSGYILNMEGQSWDEEGHSRTSCGTAYDGGDMPVSRAIGLTMMLLDDLRGGVRNGVERDDD